jgi:hypothetical protein
MALEKTVQTEYGFIAENAYHKVCNVIISNGKTMSYRVNVFANKNNSISFQVKDFNCDYDIQGDNPIKQAYKHLKTLPEFVGATDC